MVLSMTGFGAAARQGDGVEVAVEVKAVNGRFLKVALRTPGVSAAREHQLETAVRSRLRRGTATVSVAVRRTDAAPAAVVDGAAVAAYRAAFADLDIPLTTLPLLPGVVRTGGAAAEGEGVDEAQWAMVLEALDDALQRLVGMRAREGQALQHALVQICDQIDVLRQQVVARAPAVVREYQGRLQQRLGQLLGQPDAVDAQLLAREVAVFADRCDITEEVERLQAHVQQVRQALASGDEAGRTLEFLAQEMHREVNTIGAKSTDLEITRCVVALKGEVERLKEQAANVE